MQRAESPLVSGISMGMSNEDLTNKSRDLMDENARSISRTLLSYSARSSGNNHVFGDAIYPRVRRLLGVDATLPHGTARMVWKCVWQQNWVYRGRIFPSMAMRRFSS